MPSFKRIAYAETRTVVARNHAALHFALLTLFLSRLVLQPLHELEVDWMYTCWEGAEIYAAYNDRFYRDLNSDRWIQSPEC